jgi:hypothetical protein
MNFEGGFLMNEALSKLSENETDLNALLDAYFKRPKSTPAFAKLFKKFVKNGNIVYSLTFNIFAFIFGPFYMAYRRLFTLAAAVFAVASATIVMDAYLKPSFGHILSTAFAMSAVFATNYLIIRKFCRCAVAAGYGRRPIEDVIRHIAAPGGRSPVGIAIVAVVFAAYIVLSALYPTDDIEITQMSDEIEIVQMSDIEIIQASYMSSCPQKTVYQIFAAYLEAPLWSSAANDGSEEGIEAGSVFVTVEGKIMFGGDEVTATFRFILNEEKSEFAVHAGLINGEEMPEFMTNALLDKMCGE